MASTIDEIPAWVFRRGPGRREAYPYDDWFDGRVWRLVSGEDFTVNIRTMRFYIKKAAERRGLQVVVEHDGEVVIVWKRQHGVVPVEGADRLDEDHARADWEDHQRAIHEPRGMSYKVIDLDECDPELVVKEL
jgi:hypothetical protein